MKIKKKNLIILILGILCSLSIYLYVRLQPIIEVKTKNYFHQVLVTEMMNISETIEVPKDFIVSNEHQLSIHTNLLNHWIYDVNMYFLETLNDQYQIELPIGYFTGFFFLQSIGPNLHFNYLIENRILCSYDIKTTSLGINNVLIELILNIECKGDIFIGFERSEFVISESIPLALEYVQGNVPQIFPY